MSSPAPTQDSGPQATGPQPPVAVHPQDVSLKQKGVLSPKELLVIRFRKHRLAVFSLFFLVGLYLMALFAEFFAPYGSEYRSLERLYAPPQVPSFSLTEGFYVHPVISSQNPVTLRNQYYLDPDLKIPLGFFVKGEPYRLLGLVPWDRRFFGVDEGAWERSGAAAQSEIIKPHWNFLGADQFGHDVYSRLVFGARISLSIGLVSIVVVLFLGCLIGGISGYVSGSVDNLIQRGIEIINGFPELPLWLALAAAVPSDWSALQTYFAITVLLSFFGWTGLARVVRGKILSLREEDYVMAASLTGASHGRILFKHLLPGFTSHIIVSVTMSVPGMILGETALSFLGLGLRPPIVSWGVMLQEGTNLDIVANYPWLLMPVIMITLTVLAFNFLGDGLRDAADPYS